MKKLFAIMVCTALLCSMGTILVGCTTTTTEKKEEKKADKKEEKKT